jgi:hypothetical protein
MYSYIGTQQYEIKVYIKHTNNMKMHEIITYINIEQNKDLCISAQLDITI